jgi:SulP family sulfate permease
MSEPAGLPSSRGDLRADLIAGITVALLLVPQSMAYAQLVGVPPYYGLCTAFVPAIVASLFGSCPQLQTGPVAMSALLTASVVTGSGLAAAGTPGYLSLVIALSLMVGLIQLAAGLFRMAALANLLSHPVVVGFMHAGVLIIACSQLATLAGIPAGAASSSYLHDLWSIAKAIPSAHLPTLAFGLVAFALLTVLRRWHPTWPGALLVVTLATTVAWLCGFHERYGGAVVGAIPGGLPAPALPALSLNAFGVLLPGAALIALIGFVEVLAVSKAISARTGARLNLNRELIGQGLAGVVGSFMQSFPPSGSLSRSALSLYAGARTRLSGIVAGTVVLLVLLFLTPLFHHLPKAVLAALVIASVATLWNAAEFVRIVRVSRGDGAVAAVTFGATLVLAPNIVGGVLLGAGLSVVRHLYQMMHPHVALLARHPDGTFRDAERHRLPLDPRILAIRFDGRLIFANAELFEESVLQARAENPVSRALLLVAEGINEIDSSGEAVLRRLVEELRGAGMLVVFAQLKSRVEDRLKRSGLYDRIGEADMFRTPDAAWKSLEDRLGPAGKA